MSRPTAATETLWTALSRGWLSATAEPQADPRLAEDARLPSRTPARSLPPLVQAWLR